METAAKTNIPKTGGLMLLPAKPGTCDKCATDHPADAAHNQTSLYYQMRFNMIHGRWPTWDDAVAHLPKINQDGWLAAAKEAGQKWITVLPPIAEEFAVS